MRTREDHRIAKGLLAGLIGGLAGSIAMNEFQAVTKGVTEAWKRSAHQPEKPSAQNGSDEDDATMKAADRIAMLTSGNHLSRQQKKTAGPIVHYAFGAIVGVVYGALSEMAPVVTKGAGTAYGTAVWLGGDEVAVPMLELAGSPKATPVRVHANALASHLVYGASLEMVRRGVRALL
jgi:putative membrane protein